MKRFTSYQLPVTSYQNRAFTLVELLVSIGIFALMTALIVAKYGNFNQSVLLTNLAYEVALTVRTAQTYGLSVKNSNPSAAVFNYAYGVHFDTDATDGNNQILTLFADSSPSSGGVYGDGLYTGLDTIISTFAIKRGAIISGICFNVVGCSVTNGYITTGSADITFKRPDPNAKICSGNDCSGWTYVEISVKGTDGSPRVITIRENGQISVKD